MGFCHWVLGCRSCSGAPVFLMMYPTRVRDQIRLLAADLAITPVELLILARESAHDATLLSVDHLKAVQAQQLLETLKVIKWSQELVA
jgi:hypothetical protein